MPWSKYGIRRTPDRWTQIIPVRRIRIRIPQNPVRPLDIHAKDLIIKAYVNNDPWWYTLHRRGIKRNLIGENPLEKRAVPATVVRGTLPERIVYNALVNLIHLTSGIDFDFQSSQEGGRQELGGLVADFLFPYMKIVIQVQGPTHVEFLRMKKDEEQKDILWQMGYTVYDVDIETIYNEARFENWIRNLFNLGGVGGGTGGNYNLSMQSGMGLTPGALADGDSITENGVSDGQILDNILASLITSIQSLNGGGR